MTPRQSARRHLPDLDATHDEIARRFNAKLVYLATPDGTWGSDETAGWTYVRPSDADPAQWSPSTWPQGVRPGNPKRRKHSGH